MGELIKEMRLPEIEWISSVFGCTISISLLTAFFKRVCVGSKNISRLLVDTKEEVLKDVNLHGIVVGKINQRLNWKRSERARWGKWKLVRRDLGVKAADWLSLDSLTRKHFGLWMILFNLTYEKILGCIRKLQCANLMSSLHYNY